MDEERGRRGLKDAGVTRAECERAGPGEVTADGHPFHLHVNHFQVRHTNFLCGYEGVSKGQMLVNLC